MERSVWIEGKLEFSINFEQVYFDQNETRDGINVASVGRDSIASNCVYCKDKSGGSVFYRGVYVACSVPQCDERFHVSCGFNFGARFILPTGSSNVIEVTCSRHTLKRKESAATSTCVHLDEQVIAKHPTRGYIQVNFPFLSYAQNNKMGGSNET